MDTKVRPVSVDKLTDSSDAFLDDRKKRIEIEKKEVAEKLDVLRKEVVTLESLETFLKREYEHVTLAFQLKAGDVVRVKCPMCRGTGLKEFDATSGKIKGSAFEHVGSPTINQPQDDPAQFCTQCEGRKWILMDRFKG